MIYHRKVVYFIYIYIRLCSKLMVIYLPCVVNMSLISLLYISLVRFLGITVQLLLNCLYWKNVTFSINIQVLA